MLDLQNLSYAVVQVVHNFGAVAIVGGAAFMSLGAPHQVSLQRKIAWVVGAGWLAQGLSGIAFAMVSYYNYGRLPEIHYIAAAALYIKMLCVVGGVATAFMFVRHAGNWTDRQCGRARLLLLVLGVIALTSAAFLRWFS